MRGNRRGSSPDYRRLEGWKAIAHYFNKSVRTVQDWEAEGLKINRIRKRVFAYVADLEDFKNSYLVAMPGAAAEIPAAQHIGATGQVPSETPASVGAQELETQAILPVQTRNQHVWFERSFWTKWRIGSAVGFLVCVFVGVTLTVQKLHSPGIPADCEVSVNTLIVKDTEGQELFRHEFPYRLAKMEPIFARRLWAVGDVDGDGQSEIVFAPHADLYPENFKQVAAEVLCFSPTGKVKWHFLPGRAVITDNSGDQYFPPYWVAGVKVLTASKSEDARVVVSSFHHMEAPDQVAVLDGKGKLRGEYWHPGWLQFMSTADLNHDGREKLLLAGINNGQHAATLLVFNPYRVSGTATRLQDARFGFSSFPTGTEEAVVLFPRSSLSSQGSHRLPYNRVAEMRVTNNRLYILVLEGDGGGDVPTPTLTYELNFDLTVRSVSANNTYQKVHEEMEKAGEFDHKLSADEFNILAKNVSVWHNPMLLSRQQ